MKLEGDNTQTPPGRAEGPREEQGWSPPKISIEVTTHNGQATAAASPPTRKR